jgi:branched-chain amino acid transport system permease protein
MTVEVATIIIINTLLYTAILTLIALGLNIILGVLKILNLAHGITIALGAYLVLSLTSLGLSLSRPLVIIILLLAGLLGGILFASATAILMIRKLVRYEAIYVLLVTFSIMLIAEDIIKFIWGARSYVIGEVYPLFGTISLAGVTYPIYYFILIIISFIITALTYIFIDYTSLGKMIKAVASDRETAMALGVRGDLVYFIAYIIGCVLAGIGGALTAPLITLQPGFSLEFLLMAFIVVVLTGLGEIKGLPLTAFIISFTRAIAVAFIPELEMAIPFLAMLIGLAFRPQGLFGKG